MQAIQLDQNTPSYQYSLGEQNQARTITSLLNTKRNIFAAATSNLREENKIHIIELDNDQKIQLLEELSHPGIIEQLIPDPLNFNQIYVISSEVTNSQVVKKLSLISSNFEQQIDYVGKAQILFYLSIERQLQSIIPCTKEPKIYVSDEQSINQYDLNSQSFITLQSNESQDSLYTLTQMDPYHNNLFTRVYNGQQIHIIDTRDKKIVSVIDTAHDLNIVDLDFNPNKQYYFLSAGEDCAVKFWDLRKPQYSVKTLDDFPNSVTSAKFNKFHDQLISIAFDDGSIELYRATSISSVPQISQINYQAQSKEEDGVVKVYDEHEDSVSQVAWSNSTAWMFASISYNSNVIINMVPIAEKYKILL